jgi:hypothetical protein
MMFSSWERSIPSAAFWIVPWGSKTEEERGMKPNEEEVDSFLR